MGTRIPANNSTSSAPPSLCVHETGSPIIHSWRGVPGDTTRHRCAKWLVALPFMSPHVAAARVLRVRTWHAALIPFQQVALTVRAAIRVAGINRRATCQQWDSLCGTAIVP